MDTKAERLHRELIELVRLLDGGLVDDRLNRMQAYAAVDRVEEICTALGVPCMAASRARGPQGLRGVFHLRARNAQGYQRRGYPQGLHGQTRVRRARH